jgi:hypothetical protein
MMKQLTMALLAAVALLQIGDLVTTWLALWRGGQEVSPFGAFAISLGLPGMLLAKGAIVAATFALALFIRREPRAQLPLVVVLVLMVAFLLAVDVSNLLI